MLLLLLLQLSLLLLHLSLLLLLLLLLQHRLCIPMSAVGVQHSHAINRCLLLLLLKRLHGNLLLAACHVRQG